MRKRNFIRFCNQFCDWVHLKTPCFGGPILKFRLAQEAPFGGLLRGCRPLYSDQICVGAVSVHLSGGAHRYWASAASPPPPLRGGPPTTYGTTKDGPSLPQPRSGHCLVQYKGTIILTGGNGGKRSIVIYRQVKEKIEEIGNGPDTTNDRWSHGCGIFHSSQHGGRPILVIAGGTESSTTSDYWDFTVPDSKWQQSSKSYVVQFSFSLSFFI